MDDRYRSRGLGLLVGVVLLLGIVAIISGKSEGWLLVAGAVVLGICG